LPGHFLAHVGDLGDERGQQTKIQAANANSAKEVAGAIPVHNANVL